MSAAVVALAGSSSIPRPSLAALRGMFRGAMWTARLDVPWGPRPNQPDNCICIDYLECFSVADQNRIIAAYGPTSPRKYTMAPMGPLVDPGYHGQLPSTDWRGDPTPYFDAVDRAQRAGIVINHFLRPDRGVAGLDWTPDDLERELGPIFRSQRAQDSMWVVTEGWEPGPKYYYDNGWFVALLQWIAEVFPKALRGLHMVSDCDAPVGGDDDKRGLSNMQAWENVAPYIHFYIPQYGGYVDQDSPIASPEFCDEFQKAIRWCIEHLKPLGIDTAAGEYAAFGDYWKNFPESESRRLGQLAVAAGAIGYFDGGQ